MRYLTIVVIAQLTAAVMAQSVIVVDAANGPGTNYTDLPAAVAAAPSGSRIDVRAGHYSPFHLVGTALRITGAGAAQTIIDGPANGAPGSDYVTIENVPAGAVCRLESLAIRTNLSGGFPATFIPPTFVPASVKARLGISGSTGTVVLSDLEVAAASIPPSNNADGRGLRVTGTQVHAARCVFNGGGFSGVSFFAYAGGGEGGLVENGGVLASDECSFLGGSVAASFPQSSFTAFGGTGLVVKAAEARVFGGLIQGGSALASGSPSTQAKGGLGAIVVGAALFRAAGPASVTGANGGTSTFPGVLDHAAAVACYSPAVAAVHVPVTLSTNGGAATQGTGTFALGSEGLPQLTCVGTLHPDGALDAAQTATLTIAEPSLPGALFALFLSGGPGYSVPFPSLMVNELLISDFDFPVVVATTDSVGSYSLPFVAAVAFPFVLDVPLHLQAAVIDVPQNQARMSNETIRTFRL